MTTTCGCRRCAIHDDPGGCLVVEARLTDQRAHAVETLARATRSVANLHLADVLDADMVRGQLDRARHALDTIAATL